MKRVHKLKCHEWSFQGIALGLKSFELRKFDRDYRAGDFLYLEETEEESRSKTGNSLMVEISSVMVDGDSKYGLLPDYCAISFEPYSVEAKVRVKDRRKNRMGQFSIDSYKNLKIFNRWEYIKVYWDGLKKGMETHRDYLEFVSITQDIPRFSEVIEARYMSPEDQKHVANQVGVIADHLGKSFDGVWYECSECQAANISSEECRGCGCNDLTARNQLNEKPVAEAAQ